jgi:cytoskeletal protein RodZ
MGEEVRGVPEAAALAEATEGSVGRYLAGQRRLRNISLDELATLTKIPRRSLERLEGGFFDGVPDGFARGFVRTVAEALGLDSEEAVMRLLREPPGDAAEPGGRLPLEQKTMFARAAALAGVVLLALALWKLVAAWLAPLEAPVTRDVVLRHDAVRALIEQQQAGASQEDARPK